MHESLLASWTLLQGSICFRSLRWRNAFKFYHDGEIYNQRTVHQIKREKSTSLECTFRFFTKFSVIWSFRLKRAFFSRTYDRRVKILNLIGWKRSYHIDALTHLSPTGQNPSIWTDWMAQIPAPWGQYIVQMPHPVVGFVCQKPVLKNNCRRLRSSLIKLVNKHANTSRDP